MTTTTIQVTKLSMARPKSIDESPLPETLATPFARFLKAMEIDKGLSIIIVEEGPNTGGVGAEMQQGYRNASVTGSGRRFDELRRRMYRCPLSGCWRTPTSRMCHESRQQPLRWSGADEGSTPVGDALQFRIVLQPSLVDAGRIGVVVACVIHAAGEIDLLAAGRR